MLVLLIIDLVFIVAIIAIHGPLGLGPFLAKVLLPLVVSGKASPVVRLIDQNGSHSISVVLALSPMQTVFEERIGLERSPCFVLRKCLSVLLVLRRVKVVCFAKDFIDRALDHLLRAVELVG